VVINMSSLSYSEYPPELNAEESGFLLTSIKDWSIAHGLAVRPSQGLVSQETDPSGVLAVPAPLTLFPSPFPRSCFEHGMSIQKAYNKLYAAISNDEEWLGEIMRE
jgi:glutathione synthase